MAIDINAISININGVNDWLDYNDILQELADEIDTYKDYYRGDLTREEKNKLRDSATIIRSHARKMATEAAIEILESLDSELQQLKRSIQKVDRLLTEISNVRQAFAAIAEVVQIASNIAALIP